MEEADMDVGEEIIGMVKTNTKGLWKDNVENMTKNWPGGSYLVLKRNIMVTGDRLIIYIGYKKNTGKVLYLVVT